MIGRIPITGAQPVVECGRWPAKAVTGETFPVTATVFREGHGIIGAAVVLIGPDGRPRPPVPMALTAPGTDSWRAEVTPDAKGRWQFLIEAWADPVAVWRHDAAIKIPLGQDISLVLAAGAELFERAAREADKAGADQDAVSALRAMAGRLRAGGQAALVANPASEPARGGADAPGEAASSLAAAAEPPGALLAAALSPELTAILAEYPVRELVTRSDPFQLVVHRERALYGSWYEFFPRSEGAGGAGAAEAGAGGAGAAEAAPMSGTLRTAAARLDGIAAMGFDVAYLPPVHPIGVTARKGRNNSLEPAPADPGSPWAIGSADGGHDAIHPELGTLDDFDAFVARARELGMEVALDLALQCSPDHPWVAAHPEWFIKRADGSIAYAENPPKKYQDIYPLNFDEDPDGLYAEVLRVIRHWIAHGVTIFRVDNPHTKPLQFWEQLLAEVAASDPDVIFLAEAFTRPAMMRTLAALGFHQSYTYFTWRNGAGELRDYLTELAGPTAAYMRPNFFVNTPDILSEYLQHAGPTAFAVRAVLASMLSPSWGVYSGFELGENIPLRPGSEEYFDSEKYQFRPRDWEGAARSGRTLAPFLTQLNQIRRVHPALHRLRNLSFHYPDQPAILCFSKRNGGPASGPLGADTVLVVVNLDPYRPREATVWLDGDALGVDLTAGFTVTDELTGESYRWGGANYVRLDPGIATAHIFTVTAG